MLKPWLCTNTFSKLILDNQLYWKDKLILSKILVKTQEQFK